MKKILLLGGSSYLIPVIEKIHELGYYAITCDYLPDNIAHKCSDEYYNISIIDKDAVLELAQELKIDGIMSFACDPGVETAYYVAEKMGLPGHPYKSVEILQNKAKFRKFLKDNNFNVPKAGGYTDVDDAIKDVDLYHWPVIVKPVDSAGSKGVTRIDSKDELKQAAEHAIEFSKTKTFIVEEFIENEGESSDSDCFSIDGKLVCASFSAQYFDKNADNPYTPAAYSWPSMMPSEVQSELRKELQRLFDLLNLGSSIYNIETRLGKDGKPYIMEVSPRGGGNRLAEMVKIASGKDMITGAIKAAIGEPVEGLDGDPVYDGFLAEIILHSNKDGIFQGMAIDDSIKGNVIEENIWVSEGDEVQSFKGANNTIGTLVLKFDTKEQLEQVITDIDKWVCIKIK